MEYLLKQLDELIAAALRAVKENAGDAPVILSDFAEQGLTATEKIKVQLVQEIFRFSSEQQIEIYIRNNQTACVHSLDRLYRLQQKPECGNFAMSQVAEIFCGPLLSLLLFLQQRFSKYFDIDAPLPLVSVDTVIDQVKRAQQKLEQPIKGLSGDPLIDMLLEKLGMFAENLSAGTVSYRNIVFYQTLSEELNNFSRWITTVAVIYSALQQLLIYLNYNEEQFVLGLEQQMADSLAQLHDYGDKVDLLLRYAKTIRQLHEKPGSCLLSNHESVKTQLSNWIEEELQYLERKPGAWGAIQTPPVKEMPAGKKLLCQLPVDQLGIFFRAASELHLIATPSQKSLFEQISPWLSTTKRTILSADSMRSKSYSPEKKDIEAVKDLLMQLFRQVGKY